MYTIKCIKTIIKNIHFETTGGQKAVGKGSFPARREQNQPIYDDLHPGEQMVVISIHFVFFNNLRHIKARKL